MTKEIDIKFIAEMERLHFRTTADTGANGNCLFIWNLVRQHVGLRPLALQDIPAWCDVHEIYHVIKPEYGCKSSRLE